MDLKELDGFKIPFEINGETRYLKYNLNSRLYLETMTDYKNLEKKPPSKWGFDEILHYLRAMLIDSYYEENEKFIEMRNFSACIPKLTDLGRLLDEIGAEKIVNTILKGIVESLPQANVSEDRAVNPPRAV